MRFQAIELNWARALTNSTPPIKAMAGDDRRAVATVYRGLQVNLSAWPKITSAFGRKQPAPFPHPSGHWYLHKPG